MNLIVFSWINFGITYSNQTKSFRQKMLYSQQYTSQMLSTYFLNNVWYTDFLSLFTKVMYCHGECTSDNLNSNYPYYE